MSDIDRINAIRFESEPTLIRPLTETDSTAPTVDEESDDEFALRCTNVEGLVEQIVDVDQVEVSTPQNTDQERGYN